MSNGRAAATSGSAPRSRPSNAAASTRRFCARNARCSAKRSTGRNTCASSSPTTSRFSPTRSSSARFRTRRSCRYGRERWCRAERRASALAAGVFAARSFALRVGCDLAQQNDWTAVSVVEHKAGVLDYNTEWERHCGLGARPQVKAEYFDLRHLERVRGLSYVDIVDRLKIMMATPPLCGDGRTPSSELVVDATGVGRGVADLIADAGLPFIGVIITGGIETTHAQSNFWHVSKLDLVSRLDGKLHSGALRIAAALTEAPNLAEELKNFRRAVSASGRATFGARATAHDDLVLSCALAIWLLGWPPVHRVALGGYRWDRCDWQGT